MPAPPPRPHPLDPAASFAGTAARRLLGLGDPPPFELINADATTPLLLVCDHASRAIPRALGTLGLDQAALQRHIAWDIGAADLTRRLARRLQAPAVLATYSRLVIDVNRQPGDPQSILAQSDGTLIPGNQDLSVEAAAARAEAIHWPYHHAIDKAFARLRRSGPEPVFFSVHTFTPSLGGEDRHWDLSVLWNHDPRVAVPLLDLLRRHPLGLRVGDNEPYSGRDLAYTLSLHAGAAGLPHAAIEVRQDHCECDADLAQWTDLLGDALAAILAMPHLHRIGDF
jgi:predicted N-formylglutamate amidohydrolase